VLAETQPQLENALSLLAASVDLTFPQLPTSAWPLDSMGDYKSGYNYVQVKSDYEDKPFYTITDVRTHKFSDAVQVDEAIFVGEAQLTIDIPRYIR
jgi:exoribonuclease R